MLHIQLHTVEPRTGIDSGAIWVQLHSWYMDIDSKISNQSCRLLWPDPESGGDYSYFEYILPWTMEDFGKLDLSIELFGKWAEITNPVTLEISRPE